MATFHCRTAFISGVHLGTPDCKAAYLLDFLRRLRCEKLYLVGDIIDLEALGRRSGWQAEHGAVVAELLAMARHGVEVIYIPGNHDAPLRGLHGQQIGGALYLNDGDWVEHSTALVEDHTGATELIHWSEQAALLGRASRELVLPSPAAALALAPLTRRRDLSALRPAA